MGGLRYSRHTSGWDPVIGSEFLADELEWEFGVEETGVVYCHAVVVIVGYEIEVGEHVVGESLGDISAV